MKVNKFKSITKKGFTLIELMITVAIVGILAAVALPAYQDYAIKGQVSEGLELSGGVQAGIAEYYSNNGSFPASLGTLGLTAPVGKYVSGITNAGSVITVTYGVNANSQITGNTLTLTASDPGSGVVQWTCAVVTLPSKYIPSSCK